MTARELIDRRIRASSRVFAREHLSEWCDIYRTASDTRDAAGAPKESTRPVLQGIRCGVTVEDEPQEVVVNGKVMGLSDATAYLPKGTQVHNTDEIHVRTTRLSAYHTSETGYRTEHRVYNVVYVQDDATHRHLLTVKVVRRV